MGFNLKGCMMELLGTFALCYIGGTSGGGTMGAALAHGFALGFFVYAGANISGAHYNPAVTVALAFTGHCKWVEGLLYMAFQLVGGIFAGMMVCYMKMNVGAQLDGPGGPSVGIAFSWYQAAIVETVGTFFLVFTIFGVAVDNRGEGKLCGLLIGGMLTAQILAISNISGCALNPTRFFGPLIGALLVGRGFRAGPYNPIPKITSGGSPVYWQNDGSWLVYFFPFLGALIGAFSYQYCFLDNQEPELDGDEDTDKLKI
jgi:glycerol uptake facilitator-like aquaporin